MCADHSSFFNSSIDGQLGWVHFLAIVESETINMDEQVSLWCVDLGVLWLHSQGAIAESYGSSFLV